MNPTIVLNAYNRPMALQRLLTSLTRSAYPNRGKVRLVISVDKGDDSDHAGVVKLAKEIQWAAGPKEVIEQPEHLGLVKHFHFCCGLSAVYDPIIYLEDDLIVSPSFYQYASQAMAFYGKEDRVAAVSLYALWFNGYTQQPFLPIHDGTDAFFLQIPYTQGLAFASRQWQVFSAWLASPKPSLGPNGDLHDSFSHFAPDEWFPLLAQFVVETNRYVLYPRVSLTSGGGDPGTHFRSASVFFQTPLQRNKDRYYFPALEDSVAVYDSFFEILPDRLNRLTDAFRGFEYAVDLYGTKSRRHIKADHVLTSRRCRNPVKSFAKSMWPMEENVIQGIEGDEIFFCRTRDLRWGWLANLETRKSSHDFFTRRRKMGRRLQLQYAVLDILHFLHLR